MAEETHTNTAEIQSNDLTYTERASNWAGNLSGGALGIGGVVAGVGLFLASGPIGIIGAAIAGLVALFGGNALLQGDGIAGLFASMSNGISGGFDTIKTWVSGPEKPDAEKTMGEWAADKYGQAAQEAPIATTVATIAGTGAAIEGSKYAVKKGAEKLLTGAGALAAAKALGNATKVSPYISAGLEAGYDGLEYAKGNRAFTLDNLRDTKLDTATAFIDPAQAIASGVRYFGGDSVADVVQEASIPRVIDRLQGGTGETTEEITDETRALYEKDDKRFKAGKREKSRVESSYGNAPKMSDHKHLAAVKGIIGRAQDFHQTDFNNPQERAAYGADIDAALAEQNSILANNRPEWNFNPLTNLGLLPERKARWQQGGEVADIRNEALATRRILSAAKTEMHDFEQEMQRYQTNQRAYELAAKAADTGMVTGGQDAHHIAAPAIVAQAKQSSHESHISSS